MIRVLLADDHPFVRAGIRNILQRTADIVVVGEADDGIQALQMVGELNPDVLVLDMEMPGLNGFAVAHQLRQEGSDLPVLALSAHEDKQYIMGMLSHGAFGYLTKDEVPETIVKAVRGVARGERGWVSQRVAARIAVWFKNEKPDRLRLSTQDIEILSLLLKGKTNDQISAALSIERSNLERRIEKAVHSIRSTLEQYL